MPPEGPVSPAPDAHLSITFEFARDDAVEYQLAIWRLHPAAIAARKKLRVWVWGHALAMIAGVVLLFWTLARSMDRPEGAGFKIAVFLGVTAYSAWWLTEVKRRSRPDALRAQAEKVADAEEWKGGYGRFQVSVGPDGCSIESRGSQTRTNWSHVRRLLITGPVMLIEFGSGSSQPIPVRAFESLEAAQAFQQRASQWLLAANQGDAARILNFLQSNNAECPACRYDLYGIARPICPECGLVLTRETAPALLGTGSATGSIHSG